MKRSKINEIKVKFGGRFRAHLDQHGPIAVASLKKLLKRKLPPRLKEVLFETDSQGWETDLIYLYAMDRNSEEVSRQSPFGGRVLFKSKKFEIDWNYLEKHEVDIDRVGTKVLANWLLGCWREAGGRTFARRAFFQHHDDIHYFNLKSGKWLRY